MSTDKTARAKTLTCPNCGNANVKPKRTFKSAGAWFGLFVVCLFLADAFPNTPPGFAFGLAALVLFIVAFAVSISAVFGRNNCKDCEYKWR